MKLKLLKNCILLISLSMILTGCSTKTPETETPVEQKAPVERPDETPIVEGETKYDDGTYRGTYNDAGVMQVSIQYKLTDNVISEVEYRHLYYKGIDYNELKEGDEFYGVKIQHDQIVAYLEGKHIETINELYTPGEFVDDVDAFTGATVRGSKIYSAFKDGLNRGVHSPTGEVTKNIGKFDDGTYRGIYSDKGEMQVSIQFTLKDNIIYDLNFRHLAYKGMDYLSLAEVDPQNGVTKQHEQIVDYMEGKPLETIFDLYTPGEFIEDVDTLSGATVRGSKVFSAIKDGLNRGLFTITDGFNTDIEVVDGRYRGTYGDKGEQQVSIQFNIENGNFNEITYRHLAYKGDVYTDLKEGDPLYGVLVQHNQIAEYLEGKPVETIFELYSPGDFVDDVDAFSGATVKANKILSAMMDAFNRGIH